jgi:hypothetical protein
MFTTHQPTPPSSISASFIAIDDVSITYVELRRRRRRRRRRHRRTQPRPFST